MKYMIVVNFKNYEQALFKNALRLAKICEKVSNKHKVPIWVVVTAPDINLVATNTNCKVFSQHVDPIKPYRNTGYIAASDVRLNGAYGTLLNHSEHKLKFNDLRKSVLMAKRAKLKIIICASTPDEVKRFKKLRPDFIAIEPPELIAGRISVSTAKPQLITGSVARTSISILCGAGIRNKDDVIKALELGAKGILVSSGVVLSRNPEKILSEFAMSINYVSSSQKLK